MNYDISTTVSKDRQITRRGVLWVGMACDAKCDFCYCKDVPYRRFRPFSGKDGVKEELDKNRFFYGNQYIDFMGGEPTIYPEMLRVIGYCRDINLLPTVITHGTHLEDLDKVKQYRDAGIHDFLISIHALGEVEDKIFKLEKGDSTLRQIRAIENFHQVGIPFRINCVMLDWNKEQFVDIARFAQRYGARVLNLINFNPHYEWTEKGLDADFQATFTALSPHVRQAIEICEGGDLEINVRYMPLCTLKGMEHHVYNGYQLPYDTHEWNFNSWYEYNESDPSRDWYYKASRDQAKRNHYVKGEKCNLGRRRSSLLLRL